MSEQTIDSFFIGTSCDDERPVGPFNTIEEACKEIPNGYLWIGTLVTAHQCAEWIAWRIKDALDSGDFEENNEIGADDPVLELTAADCDALVPVLEAFIIERNMLRPWYNLTPAEDR